MVFEIEIVIIDGLDKIMILNALKFSQSEGKLPGVFLRIISYI